MTLPHPQDDWSARLLAAEESAPRVSPRPLSLAALEARGRTQRLAQLVWPAAAALLLIAWLQSPWAGPAQDRPAQPTAPIVEQAIQNLRESVQGPGAAADPTMDLVAQTRARANAVIERSLTNDFRANYRLAAAGDLTAWVKLQRLSRRYPDSHGGQSARAYLASIASLNQSR